MSAEQGTFLVTGPTPGWLTQLCRSGLGCGVVPAETGERFCAAADSHGSCILWGETIAPGGGASTTGTGCTFGPATVAEAGDCGMTTTTIAPLAGGHWNWHWIVGLERNLVVVAALGLYVGCWWGMRKWLSPPDAITVTMAAFCCWAGALVALWVVIGACGWIIEGYVGP